jgi:hypothetical protein
MLYISCCFQLPVGPDVPVQPGQNGCRLSLCLRYELLQELSGREYSGSQNSLVSDSYIYIASVLFLVWYSLQARPIFRILLGVSHLFLSVFSVGISKIWTVLAFFLSHSWDHAPSLNSSDREEISPEVKPHCMFRPFFLDVVMHGVLVCYELFVFCSLSESIFGTKKRLTLRNLYRAKLFVFVLMTLADFWTNSSPAELENK